VPSGRRGGQRSEAAGLPPERSAAKLDRIGIQLYTVRRELTKDVDGTLGRLAEIGYREVEFAGYPEGSAQSLRRILDRHGLTAPSSHVGFQALRSDWDRTLDQAATVGQRYVVVPSCRPTRAAPRMTGSGSPPCSTRRARPLARMGWHWDITTTIPSSSRSTARPCTMCCSAKPTPGWSSSRWTSTGIYQGRAGPLGYFAKWPGRFPLVHVKDMDATPRKYFTEVGKGIIDFKTIFQKARQAGIRHYFYEQDEVSGSPFASAKASFDYLRALSY
jgi:sugar phosphate isomerase/epimerase